MIDAMKSQSLHDAPLLRQVQWRFIGYYLEFTHGHQFDFGMLDMELPNIFSALQICLEHRDLDKFAEYFDTIRSYMVERTNGNEFLKYARLILEQDLLQAEQVSILGQMAEIEEDRGNYEEARKIYRQQLGKVKNDSQNKNTGKIYGILSDIARLAVLQADDADAKHVLEDKLEVAQKRGNYKEQANALHELGKLASKIGNLEDANALCMQSLEISRQIEYRVGEMDVLMLQGSILFGMKKIRSAFESYKAASEHAQAMNDQTRSNEARSQMEVLNTIMGKQIFISYSHHDRDFVERLANDLKMAGFPVWWDELEIKVGHSIVKKVFTDGIPKSAFLAVVLSPKSVKSPFVQRELETALMGQLSAKRITVLPLLLADCKVPEFLKVIKWADFRTDYQTGLRGLLDRLTETPIKD